MAPVPRAPVVASHPDRVLSREQILRKVWGPAKEDKAVHLRVYMAALRRKLEPDPQTPRHFLTEPGFGFRFRPGTGALSIATVATAPEDVGGRSRMDTGA